ncbi:MAG: DUF814 domain-containing protein [Acidobacteria bacterium]|nr:DUF814 domain-containing protein [Acidobacteriota bacterium]
MDAPLLLALARAHLAGGGGVVEDLRVGPRALLLQWAPDPRAGRPRGEAWAFLLQPRPELWRLETKDEAFLLLRAESRGDLSRRWAVELKGARLVDLAGDPRERWLGLDFQRLSLGGRMDALRLAFQAIPGRGGLRLDGGERHPVRIGLGTPFPAEAPTPEGDPPPFLRWREAWGDRLEAALAGGVPEILPGDGGLATRHRAWSLARAEALLLKPRRERAERTRREVLEKLGRIGEALTRDRDRHERALELKEPAQALSAELWRLKGSSGEVELEGGRRLILPPGLRAEEAVQRWFSAAKRAERGLAQVAARERERQQALRELEPEGPPVPLPPRPRSAASSKAGRPMDETPRKDGKGRALRSYEVEGFQILVGKGDADNDQLTFKVASPADFWLHVAGVPGSHVVIRNPDKLGELPRTVLERAAELAAFHSKAREGGKVEVHWCRVADVSKPRGFPPGKVILRAHKAIRVYPKGE